MAFLPVLLRRALTVTAAAAVLSLPGLSSSVRAEIVLTGSGEVVCPPLEPWCEHHIPRMFQPKTRVTVRNLSGRQMAAYLSGDQSAADQDDKSSHATSEGGDDDIDGIYENSPPRITLRIPDSGFLDLMTFTHEYGHYVWFNLLSKDDRGRYEKIYKRQAAANHLVTRYAATDLEEGFAEAFSFYVNQPLLLERRDSVSSDFFNCLLNGDQTSGAGR